VKVRIKKEMKMGTRITLFHRKSKGGVKVWSCELKGDEVHTTWGQQDGEMQHTVERLKANERMTARERALALYTKRIEKKMKKGYRDELLNVTATVTVDEKKMEWRRLPKEFAAAKPIKTYDPTDMANWARDNLVFIQRKRDGMRHFLVSDFEGERHIYSSGKDDVTDHLMPLVKDLSMPPKSIMDVELVVTNRNPGMNDKDEFNLVSGIARSLPQRAHLMIEQAEKQGMQVQLHAFDLLWWKGEPVYKKPYSERYAMLAKAVDFAMEDLEREVAEGYPPLVRMPLVAISPTRLATLSEAIDRVKKFKWEGLVVWRKDQATVVHVNGTPARVNCWKVKPVQEEDVIATGYELGKGKNHNVVGKFHIALCAQGLTGFKEMGRCGTGLDDKTRKAALSWKYPCVIQIEYDQKSDSGFRFPVFIRKRDDKKPSECRA